MARRGYRAISVLMVGVELLTLTAPAFSRAADLPPIERILEGLSIAKATQATPQTFESLLNLSKKLADDLKKENRPEEATRLQQKLIQPLEAILRVVKTLNDCGRGEEAKLVSSELLSQIETGSCADLQAVTVSETLEKLMRSFAPAQQLTPITPSASDWTALKNEVVRTTRRTVLAQYFKVRAQYTEPLHFDPAFRAGSLAASIRKVTGRLSADEDDAQLLKFLEHIALSQPKSAQERESHRKALFENTRSRLAQIAKHAAAIQTHSRSTRLLDQATQWITVPPVAPEHAAIAQEAKKNTSLSLAAYRQALYSSRYTSRPDALRFFIIPEENSPLHFRWLQTNEPLDPASVSGSLYSMRSLLKKRYGIQLWREDPPNPYEAEKSQDPVAAVAAEMETVFPGQGKSVADQLIASLDRRMQILGARSGDSPLVVLPPRSLAENVFLPALREVVVTNPDSGAAEYAFQVPARRLALSRAQYALAQESLHSEIPSFPWMPQLAPFYEKGTVKEISESELLAALELYYQKSKEFLLELDKIEAKDPKKLIKTAIEHNPSVIAQVLIEHPEFASQICLLTKEVLQDHQDDAEWNRIWAIGSVVLAVGIVLVSGGLALAAAPGAGLLLAGGGAIVGTVSAARNTSKYLEVQSEAEKTRLFLLATGDGTPGEVNRLLEEASDHLFWAVVDGVFTVADAAAFYSQIRSFAQLREALPRLTAALEKSRALRGVSKAGGQLRAAVQHGAMELKILTGAATRQLSAQAHEIFGKLYQNSKYIPNADEMAHLEREGVQELFSLFRETPYLFKAFNWNRGLRYRSVPHPSLPLFNFRQVFRLPGFLFLPNISTVAQMRAYRIFESILNNPAIELTASQKKFAETWRLTEQIARFRRDVATLIREYGRLFKARLLVDRTKGAILLTGVAIGLSQTQYISASDSFERGHSDAPDAMDPVDNKVELIFFSPVPHAAIRIGGNVFNFGMGKVEMLRLSDLQATVGFGKWLSGNHTRVELHLTDAEKTALRERLYQDVGKSYLSLPPFEDCISQTLKAVQETTGFEVPESVRSSQAGTLTYLRFLKAVGGENSDRIGPIRFAAQDGWTALAKAADVFSNIQESRLFLKFAVPATAASALLEGQQTTFDPKK